MINFFHSKTEELGLTRPTVNQFEKEIQNQLYSKEDKLTKRLSALLGDKIA